MCVCEKEKIRNQEMGICPLAPHYDPSAARDIGMLIIGDLRELIVARVDLGSQTSAVPPIRDGPSCKLYEKKAHDLKSPSNGVVIL